MKLSSDVEENPGPKPSSCQSFPICHWNLNSISAHNYMKLSLLRVYLSTHKFDVICISESYLNSDASTIDENLEIAGYTLIRADHPSNTKRGGVCISYKHSLPFKLLDIGYLEERINFEISFGGMLCNFIFLYRSPILSLDVFEKLEGIFEVNLDKVTNQNPYLIVILGHQNCRHQIIYAKINLKVFYPPPYEREIWHYQHANVDLIQRAIEQFSWEKYFRNLNINEMVFVFNKIIKNVFSNFIPHETVTCDDRDPPCINNNIKQLIQGKSDTCRIYILSDKNPQIFQKVKYLQTKLKKLIEHCQEKYYLRISKKLMNPMTSLKTYWSILKALLNNKKIPCIPPLLQDDKYITYFKKKAELFNLFFAKQCSIIDNFSEHPSNFLKKTLCSYFDL